MKNKTFAVLGLGNFGMSVADELMAGGAEVLVADRNEQLIEENAGRYTQAVIADLKDADEIQQLGLGNMDAVIVCMSQDLEASIMCVMIAKENGVHRVIAKAKNNRISKILKKTGADLIVFPEKESGIQTACKLLSRDILQLFDLTSDLVIAEMMPHKKWCGKTLSELNLRAKYGINVIAFRKGDKVQEISYNDKVIEDDEPLLVVATKENLEKLEK